MLKLDVTNRFTGKVQFTAAIDCAGNEPLSIKLGLAVRWAIKNGANLGGANLGGAYLRGADLDEQWIVQGPARSDGYFFMLTSFKDEGVRVKAGCRNFSLIEAREHWSKTRQGTPLGAETFAILDCLEAMAKARGVALMCKTTPRYWRDPSDSSYHARCRCGWHRSAEDLVELQLLADDHRPPTPKEPAPKVTGFVSGLPQ